MGWMNGQMDSGWGGWWDGMWWDMVGGMDRHWVGWTEGRKDGGGMGVQWVELMDSGWFRF